MIEIGVIVLVLLPVFATAAGAAIEHYNIEVLDVNVGFHIGEVLIYSILDHETSGNTTFNMTETESGSIEIVGNFTIILTPADDLDLEMPELLELLEGTDTIILTAVLEKSVVNQTVKDGVEDEEPEKKPEGGLSKYPPLGSDIIKVVAIEEEIDSGGGLSLRITIESNGKTYERGVRKRDYFDDRTRKSIVEMWEEDIKEIEEDAKRWP